MSLMLSMFQCLHIHSRPLVLKIFTGQAYNEWIKYIGNEYKQSYKQYKQSFSVNTKLQPAGRCSGATLLDNPRHVINYIGPGCILVQLYYYVAIAAFWMLNMFMPTILQTG